eukprot:10380903-Heterocapsa_arctica.AAC.1
MNWSDVCFKVKRHLLRIDCKNLLIGLWCLHGKRSSVAVAELLFTILSYESKTGGPELNLEHTALDGHDLRHH